MLNKIFARLGSRTRDWNAAEELANLNEAARADVGMGNLGLLDHAPRLRPAATEQAAPSHVTGPLEFPVLALAA